MGVFNLFKNMKKKEDEKPTSKFIDDEWLEVSASTKEEAIERACVALNTNESHLEIKFLSKDGKKIRARKGTPTRQAAAQARTPTQARSPAPGGRQARRPKPSENAEQFIDDEQTDESLQSGTEEDFDEQQPQENWDAQDSGRGGNRSRRDSREQQEEDFEEEVEEETDLGRKAKEILLQIVKAIDADAGIELYETNKKIRLEIESKESGLFIGKFGQTLDSIQHILKKILELKHEDGKHLVVDAEDYRVRREESIETKARKLAKKARQERRPVSVEPMNAMDRRIVHMALKGEPGIETKSVGEGLSRRVLIVPKRRDGGGRGPENRNAQSRGGNRGARGGNRGRNPNSRGPTQAPRDGNSRIHDSYDVPALSKSHVFGDDAEEYFEQSKYDDEK